MEQFFPRDLVSNICWRHDIKKRPQVKDKRQYESIYTNLPYSLSVARWPCLCTPDYAEQNGCLEYKLDVFRKLRGWHFLSKKSTPPPLKSYLPQKIRHRGNFTLGKYLRKIYPDKKFRSMENSPTCKIEQPQENVQNRFLIISFSHPIKFTSLRKAPWFRKNL